jgi:hypothetical protein
MYPNPQDVLPLPPRPDLANYRKRAKALARACRTGIEHVDGWAKDWVDAILASVGGGAESERRDAARRAGQIAGFARERLAAANCALAQAQFVIARAHGFASWTRLVHHLERLASAASDLSAFEQAADAIVGGDLAALERLLAAHPRLVHARSSRDHRATLLHYVSANGVENYRQRTPANIVAIARRLLDAGAEADAEADVYGGGATTLGLVVTSSPPRDAGAQIALADLLLERGARVDDNIVRSCLMNGCPEAAAHMAARAASLTLEEATGIGRLDLVAQQFDQPSPPSDPEVAAALMMASWYDRTEIVRFLLDRGVDVATRAPEDGHTALHIAAYRGSVDLVALLLQRGAPVNTIDAQYHTPPLVWALHAWLVEGRAGAERYRRVLHLLADAGADVKQEWLDDDRLRGDAELYAALSRRVVAT